MRYPILRIAAIMMLVVLVSWHGAAQAENAVELPNLSELTSVRIEYVSTFSGTPGIVCRDEWASATRWYSTCHDLVTANYPEAGVDLVAGRVRESLYYDGTFYTRTDAETVWGAVDDPFYDPTITLNQLLFSGYLYPSNVVITKVGSTNVGNTPTTQYQFWSLDPELNTASGGQFVYDTFITAQGFVAKDQISQRGSFPMGEGELALIWTYKDFNTAIPLMPPPTENVQPTSTSAFYNAPSVVLRNLK